MLYGGPLSLAFTPYIGKKNPPTGENEISWGMRWRVLFCRIGIRLIVTDWRSGVNGDKI